MPWVFLEDYPSLFLVHVAWVDTPHPKLQERTSDCGLANLHISTPWPEYLVPGCCSVEPRRALEILPVLLGKRLVLISGFLNLVSCEPQATGAMIRNSLLEKAAKKQKAELRTERVPVTLHNWLPSPYVWWDVFYFSVLINSLCFLNYFPISYFISSFIQEIFSKYLNQGTVLSVGHIAVNKTKSCPHKSDIGEQITNVSINI